jgi:hypothetical protein
MWLRAIVLLALSACGSKSALNSVDSSDSALTVDHDSATADGQDAITVTVRLENSAHHPLVGCTVAVSTTGAGNTITAPAPTDETGSTHAFVTSTVAQAKTVTATATCDSAAPAAVDGSVSVEFVHGSVTQLLFLVQPQDADAGVVLSPGVEVAVADALNNVADDVDGTVMIALASNPGAGVLAGTASSTLVDGVATFANLSVSIPANGYSLVATSTLVSAPVTSAVFNVRYGPPSAASVLQLTPGNAEADGVSAITALVTVVNDGGIPIPGVAVSVMMTGSGGDAFPIHGTTDTNGHFTTQLTSTVVGTPTVTATAEAVPITAVATFTAPGCTLLLPGLPSIPTGSGMAGMVSGDFDGDGHLDVAVLTDAELSIARGVGNGGLRAPYGYTTATGNSTLVAGDVNGDGHLDLVVGNGSAVTVFTNQGDGELTMGLPIALSSAPVVLALSDLDGDGKVDLIARSNQTVIVALGQGDGTFADPVTYSLGRMYSISEAWLVVADVNGDGHPDVVTVDSGPYLSVLLANADGSLQAPLTTAAPSMLANNGISLAAADLDGDGKIDLVTGGISGLFALHGNGDGTFPTQLAIASPEVEGLAILDLNGDGHPDIAAATTASGSELALFINTGNGTFTAAGVDDLVAFGRFPIAGDFDEDGHVDLAVGQNIQAPSYVTIVLNTGSGSVVDAPYSDDVLGSGRAWFSGAVADFNGDGYLDLVAENCVSRDYEVELSSASGSLTPGPGVFANGSPPIAGDFNRDGKMDILVANGDQVVWLPGNGDGTLGSAVVSTTAGAADAGSFMASDMNNDGILDVVGIGIANNNYVVAVSLGNGDGSFGSGQSYGAGSGLRFPLAVDLNNDGKPDVVATAYWPGLPGTLYVFQGNGDGTLQSPQGVELGGSAAAVASGDFNGDGKPDLVVAKQPMFRSRHVTQSVRSMTRQTTPGWRISSSTSCSTRSAATGRSERN